MKSQANKSLEIRDESKFYDKQGRLTAYALACGYIETKGVMCKLWQENETYMVQIYDLRLTNRRYVAGSRILSKARRFLSQFHNLEKALDQADRTQR